MLQTDELVWSDARPVRATIHASPRGGSRVAAWPNHLLLVTDGSFDSDGAVAATSTFARAGSAAVDLLVTYAPRIPLPAVADRCGISQCEPCDRHELARVLRAAHDRLRRVVPARADRARWTVRIEIGDPGARLVRVADRVHPDLVVVGIGQREVFDERAGGRTAVCAARYLDVPLLAAARDYAPAERCVVAFPRGKVDVPTVCAALGCMAGGGTVYLAFPEAVAGDASAAGADELRQTLCEACAPNIAARLDAIDLVRVDVADDMLTGIMELAEHVGATLIAVPNAGRPGPVRAFLPNLAEPLLFAAQCSVLVMPG